jgi:hypothetical protein
MAAPVSLNNPTLYNGALAGFIAGGLAGTLQTVTSSSTTGAYGLLAAAAEVFAAAVDTAITADAALSASNATKPATTAAISNGLASKPGLLADIVMGQMFGRYTVDLTAGDYTALVTSVVAAYTAAVAQQSLV